LKNCVDVFCAALPQVHAKVAQSICWAISRLADLPETFQASTPLSPYVVPLLRSLLETASRSDVLNNNLLTASFQAITLLVRSSGDDMINVLESELLPQMVQQLQLLLESNSDQGNVEKIREMIGAVTAIVGRIQRLTDDNALILMNIFSRTLNSSFSSGVHEESMAAIGDIATVIQSRFCQYLQAAANVICVGLVDGHKHPNLCLNSTVVLGDIAHACKEKMYQYCDSFINLLLQNLANPEMSFEIKPHTVETIGDIAFAIGRLFAQYTDVVMKFLLQAGSHNPGENPSQDMMKTINTLREAVLGTILHILQALESNSQHLVQAYGPILEMIMHIHSVFPSQKVTHLSLSIIEDMLNLCPHEALMYFKNQEEFLTAFLQQTLQSVDNETVTTSQRIKSIIQRLVSGACS